MKYAIAFTFFAIALTYLAILHGGFAWLLIWPAVSFLIVASGYAAFGARVMGKRDSGEFALWSRVILLPYRVFVHLSWWLGKLLIRELACNEVAKGLWIGRRVSTAELPAGVALIVDLTGEFADPKRVRSADGYVCAATLDASTPDARTCGALLNRIAAACGPVYIHCAQGHGRSGTLTAMVLIKRGLARDVDEAVAMMSKVRPGVKLNAAQRAFVSQYFSQNS